MVLVEVVMASGGTVSLGALEYDELSETEEDEVSDRLLGLDEVSGGTVLVDASVVPGAVVLVDASVVSGGRVVVDSSLYVEAVLV